MSKVVNLALQGGGSHGAFTWGVLERLLEEEALHFEGITGTRYRIDCGSRHQIFLII